MAGRIDDPVASSSRTDAKVSGEEARRCLEKILGSDAFRHSPRLSSFIRYVVEKSVEGNSDEISEYAIALEVFDRDPSFDSKIDSIVRVSARQLRKKLAQYYETQGAHEQVRIRLPLPGYEPRFESEGAIPKVARFRLPSAAGGLVGLVALVLLMVWLVREEPAQAHRPVVAVLPLQTLSTDPADQLLGEVLTQELTTELSRLENVSVLSHTLTAGRDSLIVSSERFELDYFLEGAVARSGDRLWLTARLTTAGNQRSAWGESFERTIREPLAVQGELSRAIASRVGEVLGAQFNQLDRVRHRVPEMYLLGKASMLQWNPATVARSVGYFSQAIEVDPDFAPAYAGLAMALRILSFMAPGAEDEPLDRARRAAEKAVALNDALAEGHASLAGTEIFEHRWGKAEQRFLRAIELDPGYAQAHHLYALLCLARQGRLDEAEREMRTALELQPLSVSSHLGLGYILYFQGRFEEATRRLEHTLELAPGTPAAHRFLGQIYLASNLGDKAIDSLTRAHQMTRGLAERGLLAYAHSVTGRRDEAARLLAELESEPDSAAGLHWSLALALTGLGREEDALSHLEAACDRSEVWALYAAVDPLFAPLRELAGFQRVRASLGL